MQNGRSAAMVTACGGAWCRPPRWLRQEHAISQWAQARMRRSLNEIACEDYRSVIVLDISSTAIEVARKHAGELPRHVTWLVGAVHCRGFSPSSLHCRGARLRSMLGTINSCSLRRDIMRPRIDGTQFGSITIDGSDIEHDVLIRLSGDIKKRKKKLSKAVFGTSHTISLDEAEYLFEKGAERLIVGSGQNGMVTLSDEAATYFKKKGV